MALSRNARIARLIGHLNPAAWDWIVPHSLDVDIGSLVGGPQPEPWGMARGGVSSRLDQVALNPQPLPPKDLYALALSDATVARVVSLARVGRMLGGEAGANMQRAAVSAVADFEEICPRWPRWPKHWPPPPPPPWQEEEMAASQLFLAGSRLVLAAEVVEDATVQKALDDAGSKLMDMGIEKAGG